MNKDVKQKVRIYILQQAAQGKTGVGFPLGMIVDHVFPRKSPGQIARRTGAISGTFQTKTARGLVQSILKDLATTE